MRIELRGKTVNPGKASGEAVVTKVPFSFLGELDPSTGKVPSPSHELFGCSLKGKVFVCPTGKGSSGGPGISYTAKRFGNLPAAIVVTKVEPVLAAAIITADIPSVHLLDQDPVKVIRTGDHVEVDADKGLVVVTREP